MEHDFSSLMVRGALSAPRRVSVARNPASKGGAKQAMKDECDINNIMRKYARTGILPQARKLPLFMDAPEFDFRGAMDLIRQAGDVFMELPAKLRREFADSPEAFVAFCQNPANVDRLVELGLATPKAPKEPAAAPDSGGPGAKPPAPAAPAPAPAAQPTS